MGSANDRKVVANAWERALSGTGITAIDVHTLLWLWSRAGFPSLVEFNWKIAAFFNWNLPNLLAMLKHSLFFTNVCRYNTGFKLFIKN